MGKTVVISGGSDGLGREIAALLSSENTVIILAKNKRKLIRVSKILGCDYVLCDVSKSASVNKAVGEIVKKHKRIDCLINNAGIWIQGELDTNDFADIQNVMNVNITGAIFMTKAAVTYMKKQKSGTIINVVSQAGLYGKAERAVYNASKFALSGFTKSMQPELAKYGIAVSGVYPGKMKTAFFGKSGVHKDMADGLDPAEVARMIVFILSFGGNIVFPEIGMKHIKHWS